MGRCGLIGLWLVVQNCSAVHAIAPVTATPAGSAALSLLVFFRMYKADFTVFICYMNKGSFSTLEFVLQILKAMMVASRPFYTFIKLIILCAYPSLKPHISFYSNGLGIWHSFPDITDNNVNNGR